MENTKNRKHIIRHQKMAVITSSTGDNLGSQFWIPFSKTATYLGMEFIGGLHINNQKDNKMLILKSASVFC